jgi:hypothetical protein
LSAIIERALEWLGFVTFASATALILYLIELNENGQKATLYGATLKAAGGGLAGAFMVLIGGALGWEPIWIGVACGSVGAIGASFIRDLANTFVSAIKAAIMARGK